MKQLKLCNLICILNIYIYTHVDMTRKRKFLRDILTGEKKGRGVSSSLETGQYGIGQNYCNSFKKKKIHRYQKMPVLRHTITDSKTF